MNKIVNGIEHVKYVFSFFDIESMSSGSKEVFDVSRDGSVSIAKFSKNTRKASQKARFHIEEKLVNDFFSELINCMNSATTLDFLVDDCSGELTISHFGGDIRLPRGLGNDDTSIGEIVNSFIERILNENIFPIDTSIGTPDNVISD